MKNSTNSSGFTLVEMLVVIVIIGILTTVASLGIIDYIHGGRVTKTKSDITILETALDLYKMHAGMYPTTGQGLLALVERPVSAPIPIKWKKGGYIKKQVLPVDPWGNAYVYVCPGIHLEYDIMSYGADGVIGGDDENKDIVSWGIEQ